MLNIYCFKLYVGFLKRSKTLSARFDWIEWFLLHVQYSLTLQTKAGLTYKQLIQSTLTTSEALKKEYQKYAFHIYSTVYTMCHFSTNCVDAVSLHKSYLNQYWRHFLVYFLKSIVHAICEKKSDTSRKLRGVFVFLYWIF